MKGIKVLLCWFLVCRLDSVTANFFDYITNFPARFWNEVVHSWDEIKEKTFIGVNHPDYREESSMYSADDLDNDYIKIIESERNGPEKGYKRKFTRRKNRLQKIGSKSVIQIPYLSHPDTQYAFALKTESSVRDAPMIDIKANRLMGSENSQFSDSEDSELTTPSSWLDDSSTRLIIFRNSAVNSPSLIDESDVIIKFDKFQIIINSTSKFADKKH